MQRLRHAEHRKCERDGTSDEGFIAIAEPAVPCRSQDSLRSTKVVTKAFLTDARVQCRWTRSHRCTHNCKIFKREAIGSGRTPPFVDAQAKAIGRRNDWGVHP